MEILLLGEIKIQYKSSIGKHITKASHQEMETHEEDRPTLQLMFSLDFEHSPLA